MRRLSILALSVLLGGCVLSDEGLEIGSWPHHATGSDDILAGDKIPICRQRAIDADVAERQTTFDSCMRSFGF